MKRVSTSRFTTTRGFRSANGRVNLRPYTA
jgi:hypothetical protein